MQKDYQQYKTDMHTEEVKARNSHGVLEKTPWLFILIGVAISSACTYYLGEQGLKKSGFYARTIGAENAAILVILILEGSLIALIHGMTTFLKSVKQRSWGEMGITVLKVVLSLNVIAAFALWLGGRNGSLLPAIEFYAQWGTPLTICGALWFWPKILSWRHKDLMRAAALETNAKMSHEWANRYQKDQQNYLSVYSAVQDSDEMQEVSQEIAAYEAIGQLAKERGIPFDQAQAIYWDVINRKRGGQQQQFGGTHSPRIAGLSGGALPASAKSKQNP